jgi:tetratricopeptide (TPR) repeat protein
MIKRIISLVAILVAGGNMLFAQSVEQGRKFLYYERYKSARETLEKVLAANPNDINAAYWLGQVLLDQKDSIAAKNVYQKILTQNGNAPLLLAGMGQIELMEGKSNDARQRFETAISLTKGKDVDVLNAVGRANVEARKGDTNYAIEKLNQATQIKGFKDPETYLILGDAYRKLVDGGNAVTSYTKAFNLDNKLAAAKHKIGKVYLTQNNRDYFLPAFEEAIKIDPAYAPTYYELFYYWYFRDVNKAAPYLDSYIANADQGPEVEYLKTDFLYASGKFADARTKATGLITQLGAKVEPRMYKLVAYVCDTLQDMACANKYITDYFAKQPAENVVPADYEELANINIKTPGSETQAFGNLQKAVALDTVVENKVKYINRAADLAKKMGNRAEQSNWLGIAYAMKKNPTQTDLYNWGFANYQAGQYKTADSIFTLYVDKYPNEIFGYLWRANSSLAMDTTMQSGIAVPHFEKLAEMGRKIDSVKYKSQIVRAYFTLASYYNDIKKDKAAAIGYLQKVLEVDPTNAQAQGFIEALNKKPAPARPAPARPKTGATGSSGSTNNKPPGTASRGK